MGSRVRRSKDTPAAKVQIDLYGKLEVEAGMILDLPVSRPAWVQCSHGLVIGAVMRPWTGTPACPLCRRRRPDRWLSVLDLSQHISNQPARVPPPAVHIPSPGLFK